MVGVFRFFFPFCCGKIIAEKHVEIKSLFDERETLEDGETIRENDEAGSFKRPQIFIDQLMKMPLMMKDAYSFSDQEISDHVYTMIVAVCCCGVLFMLNYIVYVLSFVLGE